MYCFSCYLFAHDTQASRQIVKEDIASWNKLVKKTKLAKHIGKRTSAHSLHFIAWKSVLNQHSLIEAIVDRQSKQQKVDHRLRLKAIIKTMQFLAHQDLAFCGHNKFRDSFNHGNIFDLLTLLT